MKVVDLCAATGLLSKAFQLEGFEWAALQGFPAGWHFPPSKEGRKTSIGDAVPMAMGRAVARSIAAELELPEVLA